MVFVCPAARSQATDKPKDADLDALLEKLSGPAGTPAAGSDRAVKPAAPAAKAEKPARSGASATKPAPREGGSAGQAKPKNDAHAKSSSQGKKGEPAVAPKDQELDELLQKLGQTRETPAPDDRPRGAMAPGETKDAGQPSRGGRPDRAKIGSQDKEIDDRLEELTGRRRRRNGDDGQRTGTIGEIIKEMRDVEQRLGKPDTGEGTRTEQERIVKRIDTLIEEIKRSGGSMGRLMIRHMRRPGREPGQDPGSTTGALARGVGPMKPARPTNRHSNAGGKDIWGHLPPELRQEMENQSHEEPLTLKKELIDRYYLSVGKGKLVREE
jgi:hypothetical protein